MSTSFTGKLIDKSGVRHVCNSEVKANVKLDEAKSDWTHEIGPHGGSLWTNVKTGQKIYAHNAPGNVARQKIEQQAQLYQQHQEIEQGMGGSEEDETSNGARRDMTKHISDLHSVPNHKTKAIIQSVFHGVIDTLVSKGKVELRNFGIFELKVREPRTRRNPQTGEEISMPEEIKVHFRAGKELRERLKDMQEGASKGEENDNR